MRMSFRQVRNPHIKNKVVAMLIARTLVPSSPLLDTCCEPPLITAIACFSYVSCACKFYLISNAAFGDTPHKGANRHASPARCRTLLSLGDGLLRAFPCPFLNHTQSQITFLAERWMINSSEIQTIW